jgi:hypothetical protein
VEGVEGLLCHGLEKKRTSITRLKHAVNLSKDGVVDIP